MNETCTKRHSQYNSEYNLFATVRQKSHACVHCLGHMLMSYMETKQSSTVLKMPKYALGPYGR